LFKRLARLDLRPDNDGTFRAKEEEEAEDDEDEDEEEDEKDGGGMLLPISGRDEVARRPERRDFVGG
jgi:hypothetical protein